jgi:hypothetical protein
MSHVNGLNKFIDSRKKFNSILNKAAKEYIGNVDNNNNNAKYKNEKQYQDSFKGILEFEKKFTDKQKKDINSVIFHGDNNDGVSCAYITWLFLTKNGKNKNKDILFIGIKPDNKKFGISYQIKKILNEYIKDRNVLMMDLNYNKDTIDEINKNAKSFIAIDNHDAMINIGNNIYSTGNHASCASVHKFFYPKIPIPIWVIYVDDGDMKLYLKFIPDTTLFTVFMNVRLTKSHMIGKYKGFNSINGGGYKMMNQILTTENVKWMTLAGAYMNEIQENYKGLISRNALYNTKFYGYNVVMANLEAAGLEKSVGRQMIVDQNNKYKKEGSDKKVDFAVLWSYHHGQDEYLVKLMADHKSTKHNMYEIARKISENSKYGLSGRSGGMPNAANLFLKCPVPDFIKESQQLNKI